MLLYLVKQKQKKQKITKCAIKIIARVRTNKRAQTTTGITHSQTDEYIELFALDEY